MIKEKIDDFYLAGQEDRDRQHFYISEAGKCPRAIYYSWKKLPKKAKEARVLRIMDHGDYTHMRLMAVMFSIGLIQATEITIPNQEIIHGRCDAIVNVDGKPCVVEIKSINSYGFKKLEVPKKEHVCQLQLYLHYFKIKDGILLYENKDNQDLKEFKLEYEEAKAKELIEDFHILRHMIDNNILPPIPSTVSEWDCEYCDYKEECRKHQ